MPAHPLVGREDELRAVRRALVQPVPRPVVIRGPQGAGRTALAVAAVEAAAAEGREVLRCAATASTTAVPFAAVAPVLAVGDGGADVAALLQRSAAALRERNRAGPGLVVLVDDAHLLDDQSAALVHLLALGGACPVVCTVRADLPAPAAVAALVKDGLAEEIDLGPLSGEVAGAFAAAVLGADVAEPLGPALHALAEGNPLAMAEVLRTARQQGVLERVAGLWSAVRPLPAPASLEAVAAARFRSLPPEHARALAAVVLAGPMSRHELVRLSGGPAVLEDLVEDDLVEARRDRRREVVTVTRRTMAEAVRAGTPGAERRRLLREVAAVALGAPARRFGDSSRRADLLLRAGAEVAVDLLDRASYEAHARNDLATSERFARAAIERGGGIGSTVALAEALMAAGRFDETEAVLADAAPSAEELAQFTALRVHNLGAGLGRVDDARAHVARYRSQVPDEAPLADAILASLELQAGAIDHADAVAAGLIEAGEADYAVMQGWFVRSVAAGLRGDVELARTAVQLGGPAQRGYDEHVDVRHERFRFGLVLALAEQGRLDEAEAEGRACLDAALDAGAAEAQVSFRYALGRLHLLRGSAPAAAAQFRNALAVLHDSPDRQAERWHLGGLVLATAEMGDVAGAAELAGQLRAIDLGQALLFEADLPTMALARVAAAEGRISEALDQLRAGIDHSREHGAAALEAALLVEHVRLDRRAGCAARLGVLARQIGGPLAAARHRYALGVEHRDVRVLTLAADELSATGCHGLAASAAAIAAAAHRGSGDEARAERLVNRFLNRVEGVSLGDAPGHAAASLALSPREREVAVLAASGLQSKEIAARLFLSRRTVDNHLQRVYTKLGVTRRQDLAGALGTTAATG